MHLVSTGSLDVLERLTTAREVLRGTTIKRTANFSHYPILPSRSKTIGYIKWMEGPVLPASSHSFWERIFGHWSTSLTPCYNQEEKRCRFHLPQKIRGSNTTTLVHEDAQLGQTQKPQSRLIPSPPIWLTDVEFPSETSKGKQTATELTCKAKGALFSATSGSAKDLLPVHVISFPFPHPVSQPMTTFQIPYQHRGKVHQQPLLH